MWIKVMKEWQISSYNSLHVPRLFPWSMVTLGNDSVYPLPIVQKVGYTPTIPIVLIPMLDFVCHNMYNLMVEFLTMTFIFLHAIQTLSFPFLHFYHALGSPHILLLHTSSDIIQNIDCSTKLNFSLTNINFFCWWTTLLEISWWNHDVHRIQLPYICHSSFHSGIPAMLCSVSLKAIRFYESNSLHDSQ